MTNLQTFNIYRQFFCFIYFFSIKHLNFLKYFLIDICLPHLSLEKISQYPFRDHSSKNQIGKLYKKERV